MKNDETGDATPGITRRSAIKKSLVYGTSILIVSGQSDAADPPAPRPRHLAHVAFMLNGRAVAMDVEARTSLLDLLREGLGLPGTKKGCDHGQCGACTVLVDGRRVLSCLTLAATLHGRTLVTIEGLGGPAGLHPLQQAFVAHDALQCGFCTPGQIMSAAGFLKEPWPDTAEGIREGMSGNLCRCGAYCGIVAAVSQVRSQGKAGG
ncbi:MAG TPA: (2Fe-2S)-binding protein [Opitutaceae bacterium]